MPRTTLQRITLVLITALTIIACLWVIVHGQTQDYINGNVASELRGLGMRIEVIEGEQRYIFLAIIGGFVVQLFNVITSQQSQRQRRHYDPDNDEK
jgi:TRAP-type C4-dicarboxylate transport system permease small subunit